MANATATYWTTVPTRTLSTGKVVFTSKPFFSNGADSNVTVPCWGCGVTIGYAPVAVEAMSDDVSYAAFHTNCA